MNRPTLAAGLLVAVVGASPALAVNPTGSGVTPGAAETKAATPYKTLMTAKERSELRNHARNSASTEQCIAYVTDWQGKLEARAKEKGVVLASLPKTDVCERAPKAGKPDKAEKPVPAAAPEKAAPSGTAAPAQK